MVISYETREAKSKYDAWKTTNSAKSLQFLLSREKFC